MLLLVLHNQPGVKQVLPVTLMRVYTPCELDLYMLHFYEHTLMSVYIHHMNSLAAALLRTHTDECVYTSVVLVKYNFN